MHYTKLSDRRENMNEKLLQFIWQFQYCQTASLKTVCGKHVTVQYPGERNVNQGPDFLDARIRIGDTAWAGNIEMHVLASDWEKHRHGDDDLYKNIILHVVWRNDAARRQQPPCPVVELQPLVPKLMLQKYQQFMENTGFIPCAKSIDAVPSIIFTNFRERLLVERMQQKTQPVLEWQRQTLGHWEETFWRMLARNFGITVNAEAFESMACNTSAGLLARNKHSHVKIESLLMGQCGLLNDLFTDQYPQMLQQEYRLMKTKYGLTPSPVRVLFLRMRPGSFPTIRLSQLAALVYRSQHLFSKILDTDNLDTVMDLFRVQANDYWLNHYKFDEPSKYNEKQLGEDMLHNIIINTVAPVLFAYGIEKNEIRYKDRALEWIAALPAEKNTITAGFQKLDVKVKNAAGSQALIQLKNNYCRHKRCLECAVGVHLLKKQAANPALV